MADRSEAGHQHLRVHLNQLGLHVNEPEPVIICRLCTFALRGSAESIVNYLTEKHNVSKQSANETRQLLRPYIILGPKELRLRSDGSPPHPYLAKHLGIACKQCGFKTTSVQVVGRHLSKDHGLKRKSSTWLRDYVIERLTFQSWDRNGTYGYWVVALDRLTTATSSFDNSLL